MKRFRKINLLIVLLFACLLTVSTFTDLHAQYVQKVLVKSGDPAPGTNGAIFNQSSWNPPISIGISHAGDVLFKATLESGIGDVTSENIKGLWIYEPSVDTVRLVFRPGEDVPGMTGATFTSFDEQFTSIDPNGQIGILASYSIGGVIEDAFFMEARGTSGNGTLLRKVYEGMELLPAIPGATILRIIPVAFSNGRLLFTAVIEGEGITRNWNDLVICMYDQSGISVIVRKTDPMPSVGNEYISYSVTSMMENAPLDILGRAVVQFLGKKSFEPNIRAAYYYNATLPLIPIALSHLDTTKITFGDSRLNSTGGVVRRGSTDEIGYNIRTLVSGPASTGVFNTIITEDDLADGASGATFDNIHDFVLFDDNQIAIQAYLSDGKAGIWIGDETGLNKVAMVGDIAPGVDTSMRFFRVNNMMANRVGKIAFFDLADNGVDGVSGLWIGNRDGLEPVSLSDQAVELDSITVKTIESQYGGHTYWTRTGADGYSTLLNDSGKIAYGVTFLEGGNALILGSPGGLIVNSNRDLPDIDTTDGRCYTGFLLPDGRPECTFRAAITEANAQRGPDMITFDIEGDTTIAPQTDLPTIKDSMFIDATTQPNGEKIVLDGSAPNLTDGLFINGTGNTIKGLVIGDFPRHGIVIASDGGENRIYGCVIGYTGSFGFGGGNGRNGILVRNSSNNTIGGVEPGQSNRISNNKECGIVLDLASSNNRIFNNEIGLTFNLFNYANGDCGILIQDQSNSNIIGGGPDSMNFIVANDGDGIAIVNSDENKIDGNIIADNLNGVSIEAGSQYNILTRNRIGLDRNGEVDGNKHFGVQIFDGSESNSIGGTIDDKNIISTNDSGGVLILDSDFNRVSGNYIGTNVDGSQGMGNHGHGIEVNNCFGTTIGQISFLGSIIGTGNIISGNDSGGVAVLGGSDNTIVTSNLIGVGEDSLTRIGNQWGVIVDSSPRTYIGHDGNKLPGLGNTIEMNKSSGLMLFSDSCSVISNSISYNGSIVNSTRGDGIYIDGFANLIGLEGLENELYENNGAGVYVADDITHNNDFNRIQYNKYYSNFKGGLDLAPLGINPIDNLDLDDGPNDAQNAPHLVSVTYTLNDVLFVKGVLHSKPNETYHVIVYSNDDCYDWSFPNEGFLAILEDTVTTDANGDALIDISEGPWNPPVPFAVTMNVTDMSGNTSEFSNCLYVWDQPIGVDLVVTKTDNADSVSIADTLRYEITVTNAGSDQATNVVLTDSLPSLISYVVDSSDHGTCLFSNGLLTCNLGTMPPFDVATIRLTAVTNSLGLIENSVLVTAAEVDVDLASNVAVDSTISSDVYTDVSDETNTLPYRFELSQNYPNPFNPTTTINYDLPVSSHVTLKIFNVLGQEIRSLIDSEKPAGYHTIVWDGLDRNGNQVSSGVYLYRLNAKTFTDSKKMILMK